MRASEFNACLLLTKNVSLMAKWLEEASQGHDMHCHELAVMGLNTNRVKCSIHSTFI